MVLAPVLSALTLVASAGFAVLVLRQWSVRRRAHQLLWGSALALFALASALEVAGLLGGWAAGPYKAYFVLTAVMVGLMGAGTGFLVSPRLGRAFTAYVVVLAQALAFFAFVAGADAARLDAAARAGEVPTRVLGGAGALHALLDVPAALLLVGGALHAWRSHGRPHALLIAAGAVAFTGIHSLASGAQTGLLELSSAVVFSAGSLVGVLLLFAGYALASRPASRAGAREGEVADA